MTSAQICNNPRVVKEADALHALGHEVRVVGFDFDAEMTRRDMAMVASRGWTLDSVPVGPQRALNRHQSVADRVMSRLAREGVSSGFVTDWLASRAAGSYGWRLGPVAASQPADVVIAHNLQALPAAAWAARRLGSKLVFDFEDLHSEEHPATPEYRAQRQLARTLERRFVRRCDGIIASSDGIADAVMRLYGVPRPTVVMNAFPVPEAPPAVSGDRRGPEPSLYWYSQVIGPGRGLEDVVDAMGRLRQRVHLHLRGASDPDFVRVLRDRADALGVGDWVFFHSPADADELVSLATQHDIGLALELPLTLNRSLCVTNKILTYLVAGLAVAATDTEGQRSVLDSVPGAGFLYSSGDAQALAQGIQKYLDRPELLAQARRRAASTATGPLSWESQMARLTDFLVRVADGRAVPRKPAALASSASRRAAQSSG